MRELPPELMQRFTQIDYAEHLALVAEVFVGRPRDRDRRGALRARRRPDWMAEFAVSVAEAWQGNRLASLLLGKLACRAAAAGVRRIVGETLATNARMISLARKAGFTLQPQPRGARPDAAGEGHPRRRNLQRRRGRPAGRVAAIPVPGRPRTCSGGAGPHDPHAPKPMHRLDTGHKPRYDSSCIR